MTEPAQPSERPSPAVDGTSRRSRSRRSQRPATDGIAEDERELITEAHDTANAGPPDDGPDAADAGARKQSAGSLGAGSDDWWQEQRPPHWG